MPVLFIIGGKNMTRSNEYGKVVTKQWVEENYHGEEEFIIPEGFIAIGEYAFRPDYYPEDETKSTKNLKKVIIPDGVLEIDQCAFYECENLREVIMPDTVRIIEDSVFFSCQNLEYVRLSENLYKIGRSSFEGCTSLKQIKIPDSVCFIEYEAFESCWSLADIKLSHNLIAIPYHTFYNCKALETINLPESVKILGTEAFAKTPLKEIDLCDVQVLGTGTFEDCIELKKVNLCDNLEIIPRRCFSNCNKLETVHLHDAVKVIEQNAFIWCDSLAEINIPNNIKEIQERALAYTPVEKAIPYIRSENTILKIYGQEVEIPEGVTQINPDAFEYETKFISLPKTLQKADLPIKAHHIVINGSLDIFQENAFHWGTTIEFMIDNIIPVTMELQNNWQETDAEQAMIAFIQDPTYEKFCAIPNTDYKISLAISYGMSEHDEYKSFQQYLRKVGTKAIIKMIDDENFDTLDFYIEAGTFTQKACDIGLEYAQKKEMHEVSVILMQYKNSIKGYKKNVAKQFDL